MARKKYGTTAWGAWFLNMLNAYDGTGRLSRGKSYANTGKVFELKLDGQSVSAKVTGHYDPFYRVTITFPEMSEKTKAAIDAIFSENDFALAGLKQGFMSDELIQIFEARNIELIPAEWKKLRRKCSCPDSGDPCKHMAAVLFILAREIDFDPRLIFQIAGYPLGDAAAKAEMQNGKAKAAANTGLDAQTHKRAEIPIEAPVPIWLREKTDQTENTARELLNFERNENYIELITKLLPKSIAFSDNDFSIKLRELYHTALQHFNFQDSDDENTFSEELKSANLCYAQSSVDEKNLQDIAKNFPLNGDGVLTLRIDFNKTYSYHFTLLQAENFFMRQLDDKKDFTESFCILYSFYSLAKKIIYECAFVPAVSFNETTNEISIFWKALTLSDEINSCIEKFSLLLTKEFFPLLPSWGRRYCAEILLTAYLTEFVRSLKFIPKSSASDREIDALFFSGSTIDGSIPGNTNLAHVLYAWALVFNHTKSEYRYRLMLTERKIKKGTRYYTDGEYLNLSAEVLNTNDSNPSFVSLPNALAKTKDTEKILQVPIMLSSYLPTLSKLAREESLSVPINELVSFLTESVTLLRRFGIEIILPKSLQKTLKPKKVLSVTSKNENATVQSFLNLQELLSYDLAIMLGDEKISVDEFKTLVKKNERLVKFKNKYVLLDPHEVQLLLNAIDDDKKISQSELMQEVLIGDAVLSDAAKLQVETIFKVGNIDAPTDLNAKLRPYQHTGFAWMYSNIKSGFGCLLADDMGLGKTIQVLSLMLTLKAAGELHTVNADSVLIICPASLISNWTHETKKFAPSLQYCVFHGSGRKLNTDADIIFTTYQTMQLEEKILHEKKFAGIIIDEAQAIKNAATKSARSLKKLKSSFRIALTGTPVENSLEDLRSIFDFIMPAYLGDTKTFKTKWRIPIERHADKKVAEDLKKITAPFILRRLKTDKNIISDLPEKIVSNNYCSLTPEQVALYQAIVETELQAVQHSESAVKRRALILKLLTNLKQVCNHPHAFDKNVPCDFKLSGKMQMLIELLCKSFESGEKVLVFSQYVETLKLIQTAIESKIKTSCLLITGRQSQERRSGNVALFQNDSLYRVLLISLKAGGTGLNLTAANRVVHYDLWYNPAVEDQATDRAFRIGQKSNVFVNRFICAGTFEEKIDTMIQQKRKIAGVIAGSETWISRLSDSELAELLALA